MKSLETLSKSFNTAHQANIRLVYDTKDMSHDTWLSLRSEGIGGSEIAAIMNASKYDTPLSLWTKKTGRAEAVVVTEQMNAGHLFEEVIAKEFSERYGWKVRRLNYIYSHPDYEWTRCNVDFITQNPQTGAWGILEIKNPSEYSRGDWDSNMLLTKEGKLAYTTDEGSIPEHYHLQGQYYAGCAGLSFVVTCGLIGGFTLCPVYRNLDISTFLSMIAHGEEFWKLVETDTRPDASYMNKVDQDVLKKLAGRREEKDKEYVADGDTEILHLMQEIARLKAQSKTIDETASALTAQLIDKVGDSTECIKVEGKKAAYWTKAGITTSIDRKLLEKQYPDVFEQVKKESKRAPSFVFKYSQKTQAKTAK